MSDPQMTALAAQMQVHRIATTRDILRQGEATLVAYLVLEGRVEVSYIDIDGNKVLAHLAQAGEVIGEVEVFSGMTCAATCTALRDTILATLDASALRRHVPTELLLRNLAQIFHDRLVRDNRQQTVAMFYGAEDRIRIHLLALTTPHHPEAFISQFKLAAFAGCSRQTVNRTLAQLRDEGLIQIGRGNIRILDRDALERLKMAPD